MPLTQIFLHSPKWRLMLPFVVSGVYVVGGGLTAGSMMALLLFCRLLVGQFLRL